MTQAAIRSFVHCEDVVINLSRQLVQQRDAKASALRIGNAAWLVDTETTISRLVRSLSIAKAELVRCEDACAGIAGFKRSLFVDDTFRTVVRTQIPAQSAPKAPVAVQPHATPKRSSWIPKGAKQPMKAPHRTPPIDGTRYTTVGKVLNPRIKR